MNFVTKYSLSPVSKRFSFKILYEDLNKLMNIPILKNNPCTVSLKQEKKRKSTRKERNILLIFQCNDIEEKKSYILKLLCEMLNVC